MTNKTIELLSPAGDMDSLMTAVQSGADAVYLGGKLFGARGFAKNFDDLQIEQAVDYCHLRDVLAYVTVNTLILDKEIKEFSDYIQKLSDIGVDAVIVQDIGMIEIIKRIAPDLPIHASTQMSIHNLAGALELQKLGVERVILARELSKQNIEYIIKNCDIEIEVFVHGALCMCYSGQCLMSSVIGGGSRSANRGRCAQPCRLLYSLNDTEKRRYLSLKDLCLLEHINELKEIGVKSLKIEGRMKGAAYVSKVTSIYRKYLDNNIKPSEHDLQRLRKIFDRGGLTNGYYTNRKGPDMFSLEDKDNPYESTESNKQESNEKKVKLECIVTIQKDSFPQITISDKKNTVVYALNELPQAAKGKPLIADYVASQINKTGGTPFEFIQTDIELDDNLYLSVAQLNKLRRDGLELFEKNKINSFKRNKSQYDTVLPHFSAEINEHLRMHTGFIGYSVSIISMDQFDVVKNYDIKRIYAPVNLVCDNMGYFADYKNIVVLTLPDIITDDEVSKYEKSLEDLHNNMFVNLQVDNIAGLNQFKRFSLYGGMRLNIFNSSSVKFLGNNNVLSVTLSPELNLSQIRDMKKYIPVEVTGYGRLPLMITENCVIRHKECSCNDGGTLIDRKGIDFKIIKSGSKCRNILLNSRPIVMNDKIEDILNAGVGLINLMFTIENKEKTKKICELYINKTGNYNSEFTRGHFYKGVN